DLLPLLHLVHVVAQCGDRVDDGQVLTLVVLAELRPSLTAGAAQLVPDLLQHAVLVSVHGVLLRWLRRGRASRVVVPVLGTVHVSLVVLAATSEVVRATGVPEVPVVFDVLPELRPAEVVGAA